MDTLRLHIPTTKLKTYGDRSFSHAAPTHWHNLDVKIRSIKTIQAFKTALKKLLFESYYHIIYLNIKLYFACVLHTEHTTRGRVFP